MKLIDYAHRSVRHLCISYRFQEEEELDIWLDVLDIIYSGDEEMELGFTGWLQLNHYKEPVSELLERTFTGGDRRTLHRYLRGEVWGQLPARIIYPLIGNIESRVTYLKKSIKEN